MIDSFRAKPLHAAAGLRELLANEPAGFAAALIGLLKSGGDSPGTRYVLNLVATSEPLARLLSDPAALALDNAVYLATRAAALDRHLDVPLARLLLPSGDDLHKQDAARLLRSLEVLSAISDGARLLGVLVRLLRHPSPRVRSKAALLVGRGSRSAHWVDQCAAEPDARVRANIVEALWGVDSAGARALLRQALRDPDNRTAGNAAVGLHRLGESEAAEWMHRMAADSSPRFRATAAWAMGHTEDPQFLPSLEAMLGETEPTVRRNVLRALGRIRRARQTA